MVAEVTVRGLGRMGGALARAFHDAGHTTHGWSRSTATRDAASAWCMPHETAGSAVAASRLIVVCLPDYDTTMAALCDVPHEVWSDETMLQTSSCAPSEAPLMQTWARERNMAYIDGAIATFPSRIGHRDTCIFMSGDRPAYLRARPILDSLGGRNTFVSDDVSGAAALDLGWLSLLYGVTLGLLRERPSVRVWASIPRSSSTPCRHSTRRSGMRPWSTAT